MIHYTELDVGLSVVLIICIRVGLSVIWSFSDTLWDLF